MEEQDQLIVDMYKKYADKDISQSDISTVKELYGDDFDSMINDIYTKYKGESLKSDDIKKIRGLYNLSDNSNQPQTDIKEPDVIAPEPINPESQVTNPFLSGEVSQQAQPRVEEQPLYDYQGEQIDRNQAMDVISNASDVDQLSGLNVTNDPEILDGMKRRLAEFNGETTEIDPTGTIDPTKPEKGFWENWTDAIYAETPAMIGNISKGISEIVEVGATAPSRGFGSFENYAKLKRNQAEGEIGSLTPNVDRFSSEMTQTAKKIREEREVDTESWGYLVGSLVPQTAGIATAIGVGAVNPVAGAAIGYGNAAALGSMAIGAASNEYDEYISETNNKFDPNAKLGAMMLSFAAETGSEAIPVAKLVPPALRGKLAKVTLGNIDNISKTGKQLLQEFAKSSTNRARMVKELLESIGTGIVTEGPTEGVAEVGNEFATWLYKEKKDRSTWGELLTRTVTSIAAGSLMGGFLGPLSYGAKKVSNNKRREKAGKIVLAQNIKSGETLEITGNIKGKTKPNEGELIYQAIRPNGKPIEVSKSEIGEVVEMPLDDFKGILKGKLIGGQAQEAKISQDIIEQSDPAQEDPIAPFDPENPIQIGETINMGSSEWVVTGVDTEAGTVQIEGQTGSNNGVVESLSLDNFQELRKPNISSVILSDGTQEREFIENPDGTLESVEEGMSEAEANAMATTLSEKYPNLEFSPTDNTNQSDPYAETDFTVNAKPKEAVKKDVIPSLEEGLKKKVEESPQEPTVDEPSIDQQLEDVTNGDVVSFTYKNELEVPDVFKDKISSKGDGYVRVTIAKSLAEYELSKTKPAIKPTDVQEQPTVPEPTGKEQPVNEDGGQEPSVEASGEDVPVVEEKIDEPLQKGLDELRAEEQAELKALFPNIKGKINENTVPEKDKGKYQEVHDRYDKLITPLIKDTQQKPPNDPVKEGKPAPIKEDTDKRPKVGFTLFGEFMEGRLNEDGSVESPERGMYLAGMVDNIVEINDETKSEVKIRKQKDKVSGLLKDLKDQTFKDNQGIAFDFKKKAEEDIQFFNTIKNLVTEYTKLKGMQFSEAIKRIEEVLGGTLSGKNRGFIKDIWDESKKESKPLPIKKQIKESTEGKPSKEKNFLTNEYQEFKKNLRERAKVLREAEISTKRRVGLAKKTEKERVKRLKSSLEKFIKINSNEINKLGAKLNTAILRKVNNIQSELGLEKALEYIEKVLNSQELRNEIAEKESLIGKIKKEANPKNQETRQSGIKPSKRKQTADGISVLKKIYLALKLDRITGEGRIQVLQKELQNTDLDSQERFDKEAEIYALNFSGLEEMSNQQIKALLDELKEIKKSDKIDALEVVKKWRDKIENNVVEASNVIDPDNKVSDKVIKPSEYRKKSGIRSAFLGQDNWIWLMDKLSKFDKSSNPLSSFLNKKFDRELVAKPNREEQKSRKETIKGIQDKFSEIFGIKKAKGREKILTENSIPQPFTYTDINGNKIETEMSMNAIYKRWMEMQDETLFPTFTKMGIGTDYLNKIEAAMTPEIKQWAEWQLNEFYPKYVKGINKVYREVFGIDMPMNEKYSPIRRITNRVQDDSDITFGGSVVLNSANNGSLNQRVGSVLPLQELDGDKALINYVYQMEFFKAQSLPLKELSQSLLDQRVLKKIEVLHGPEYIKAIKNHINSFYRKQDNQSIIEEWMADFRKTFTVSTLAVNPVSLIKQFTSIPAYANWIPTTEWVKRSAKFWSNPYKKSLFLYDNSEWVQLRLDSGGFDRDAAAAMSKDWKQSLSGKSKLSNDLMFMTKWGDSGAIFIGGYAIYDYHYNQAIKENMSPVKAKDFAISKFEEASEYTQQATDTQNLNLYQKGSEFYKVATMYKTSPIAYHALAMGAIRNLSKGRGTARSQIKQFAIFHVGLPVLFQWASTGFRIPDSEDDEDFWFDIGRAAIFGNINAVFMAGDFAEYSWKKLVEGKPFDYVTNTVIDSLFNDLYKTGEEVFDVIEDFSLEEIMEALDQILRTSSRFVPALSWYNQTSRITKGAIETAKGETEFPVQRALGWSDWALGENPYSNRQKNKLLEYTIGKDYKKKKKKSVDGSNEIYDINFNDVNSFNKGTKKE